MIYTLIAWFAILVCVIGIIFGSIYAIFPTKRSKAKNILKIFSIALGVVIISFFSFKLYLKYFYGVGEGEKIENSTSLFSIASVCGPGLKAIEADTLSSFDGKLVCGIPLCSCYVCTKCGDGVCGKGENHCNCKEDCKEGEGVFVESDDPKITSMGTIGNSLEISGKIKGNWFFEGQLPVKLMDERGNLISKGTAVTKQIKEDWVSFKTSFPNTDLRNGTLIFSKDNPSGLPQNDKSVSVPFSF